MSRYWDAAVQCLRRIASEKSLDLEQIRGIAVSSQAVTFVPVDERGRELGNAIFFYDTRATREAERIRQTLGDETLYQVTGVPSLDANLEAAKLLWIRENEPERFRRIHKILLVHDYLLFRLTGEYATVNSIQSTSLLLDIRERRWWPRMLAFLEIPEERLPRICRHGEAVGTVGSAAAGETGLARTAVVVAGGIDQICGMIGVGNIRRGIISESTGSVLALHVLADSPYPTREGGAYNFCAFDEKSYAVTPICPTAGTSLSWFAHCFCSEERGCSEALGASVYDLLTEGAARVEPGADGLAVLPFFSGSGSPKPDLRAKAAFYGVTLSHTKRHFVRALLESVACLLRSNVDTFRQAGWDLSEIRSFGGGSRSPLWNQIKADLCGLPVTASRNAETGCIGAAVLAGVGCGALRSLEEACESFVRLAEPVYPDAGRRSRYEEVYARYQRLARAVEPLHGT